ncbi:hypothetical protein [Mesorhizobium abyssinicae]|uniref:hypothetical protein n=1 Tax=Mesorhizobium abyssinicae TaxID=1209958 RepID=UPI0033925B4F
MIPPPTTTTSTAPTAGCGWNADTVLGLCQIGSENGLGKEHLEMQWARENRIADFMDLKVASIVPAGPWLRIVAHK